MRFAGDAYRAHDPRWSFTPLSGEGAASQGARFNPKGVPALYLALTLDGAIAEAAQGFAFKMEPLILCLYEVDCEDVVDLASEEGRGATDIAHADLGCPWRLDLAEGRVPASWSVARGLIKAGAAGMLAPSFARGAKPEAVNLVLWRWGPDLPHRVTVHDPSGRLPRDQLSWER